MSSNKLIKCGIILKTAVILFILITGMAQAGEVSFENTGTASVPTLASGIIEGKISAMGKNYIVVVYRSEKEREYEVLLPVDPQKIKIKRKKDLSALNIGDTVSIEYEDTQENALEGQRMKRNAKVISFVSPAPPNPPEPEVNW
ncbi:MAG: hypothetical protein AAB089_03970 [Nitrospirota bacterium]